MKASDLVGKTVSFDHHSGDGSIRRLSGIITEAKENGRTLRGDIPDFLVTVRGSSGATKTVSYVETYMKDFQP